MIPKLNYTVWLVALKRWGPVVFWMFVIFSASADSGSVVHSSRILEPLLRFFFPNITFAQLEMVKLLARKAAHVSEFALLALLFLRALSYERGDARKWISSAWVLATAYAASDELHQLFVPGRDGKILDVVLDSMGAAFGLWVCSLVLRFRANSSAPKPLKPEHSEAAPVGKRPSFADQLLCTLQGQDMENRSEVRFSVQDRLQREHGGRLILGRNSKSAHLCIKNTSISGQHFSLLFRNGQFEVEDLDSSNGTRVNGRKLAPFRPVQIADGDRIEAGEVLLHFRRLA
ncbi:MAG: VanZ family protein [Verrucomicrobia bacterium]|nr:VanZ family protein [Verrucomicrobiota bacterium]